MAEYIEKALVLNALDVVISHAKSVTGGSLIIKKVCGIVENMRGIVDAVPVADVAPVVHGRWDWNGKCWECSNCRCNRFHDLSLGLDAKYCGRCGAKMEG